MEDGLPPSLRTGTLTSSCLLPPPGALEIRQALPVHAGRYTCTAQNSAGVARKHVALAVQGRVPGPSAQTAVALGAGEQGSG